jgi:hypothetical protein
MDKMKKVAKAEVKAHEERMHGKSYKKGGVTSLERKQYGKGMAKVMNQQTPSFTYKKSAGRGR